MNNLDEMWAALAVYQPKADKEGHGKTWAAMCREKTSVAAEAAWSAAEAAADAAKAAGAAYAYAKAAGDAYAYAKAAGDAGDAGYAAYASANADRWAQSAIDRINKLNEAQPKQEHGEPVAWCRYEDGMWVYYETKAWDDLQPLYTTPQQRKPLTDEEISTLWNEWKDAVCLDHKTWAKAIEASHGIKE